MYVDCAHPRANLFFSQTSTSDTKRPATRSLYIYPCHIQRFTALRPTGSIDKRINTTFYSAFHVCYYESDFDKCNYCAMANFIGITVYRAADARLSSKFSTFQSIRCIAGRNTQLRCTRVHTVAEDKYKISRRER